MKQKIQILIPLTLVAALLIYCWTIFLSTDLIAVWRHYIGLILFMVTVVIFFRSLRLATFVTGIYLLLATFNLLAFTPEIKTSRLGIGPVSTPPVQLVAGIIYPLFCFKS